MGNAISIKDLSKRYGKNWALSDVSFDIAEGEVCALVGENGAGKSTLIDILLGLLKATKGSVSFFGESGRTSLAKARRNIGFVPDGCGAFLNLTGRENLTSRCIEWGLPKSEVNRVLAAVGLENAADASVKQYSLGMKRRLDIGAALLGYPRLLIMDEPINGLDPVGIKEFRQLVQRLNEELNMTFIISSHILSELYLVATKFGIIENGQLIKEITKAEFEEESEDYIVLKTNNLAKASSILHDHLGYRLKVVNATDEIHIFTHSHEINTIIQELGKMNIAINEIYYARQDLEKYFTDLVK